MIQARKTCRINTRSLHHKKPSKIYESRRKMRKSCVCSENGSEYTTSDGKPWWRCARCMFPCFFFLSYTSTRIPAIRIIRIFSTLGTEESWDDISNLAPRRDFLLIRACSLARNMFHCGRRGTAGFIVLRTGAQGKF